MLNGASSEAIEQLLLDPTQLLSSLHTVEDCFRLPMISKQLTHLTIVGVEWCKRVTPRRR